MVTHPIEEHCKQRSRTENGLSLVTQTVDSRDKNGRRSYMDKFMCPSQANTAFNKVVILLVQLPISRQKNVTNM